EDRRNWYKFKAINCYSSEDLVNWKFEKEIITKNSHPILNDDSRFIERPKIIYNKITDKYIIWLHWENSDYSTAEAAVFYCDQVNGDFIFHKAFRPFNNMSRDCNLFVDDDGTAFFISAANHNADLIIYKLTQDYLDVAEQVITLWPGMYREAPVLFKVGKVYYLITSGATGWDPNQGKFAYASSIAGPWSNLFNLGDGITFDSQPANIIQVIGSVDTTIIYCGDRWQDPTLPESKYIWLPLEIESTALSLNYYDGWKIDLIKG
ncbi:unnamed protein product, partial [marine sediment metagenome]